MFSTRLKSARLRKGLSIQELADKLEPKLTKQAISRYEQGLSKPSMEVIFQLCEILELRPDYFLKAEVVELGIPEFRKLVRFSKKEEYRVIEEVREFLERYLEAEQITGRLIAFENPIQHIPVTNTAHAELAALELRKAWRLDDYPLSNIVELLEEKGIKVLTVKADNAFNGFATWVNKTIPLIVLNNHFDEVPDRKRFTTLHELGHLLMRCEGMSESACEKACNRFAGAMLLPESAIYKELGERRLHLSLAELGHIKMQYGISMVGALYRANDLSIISDFQFKNIIRDISMKGYKTKEPLQFDFKGREEPLRFEQIVLSAWSEGMISLGKASVLLNMKQGEFMERYMI